MKEAVVSGRFIGPDGSPLTGTVRFVPSKIWIDDDDGHSYPCHAPERELDDGQFRVRLTCTDTYLYDWYYTVITPLGNWRIVVEGENEKSLRDLLPRT